MNKWQDAAIHVVVAKEQLVEAVAAILARLYVGYSYPIL